MELTLGIVQFCAWSTLEKNLGIFGGHLRYLGAAGAELAVFPEYCTCLGGLKATRESARTMLEWCGILGKVAAENGLAIVFGGVPTLLEDGKIVNRGYVFERSGEVMTWYDKMHLYPNMTKKPDDMDEWELFTPGNKACSFEFKGWRIGLSICFDLRFPEVYMNYRDCDLVLCTAAFAWATGKCHWNALLRARAIENQFWIAGAGQGGENSQTGMKLYGHSAVYDPWGNGFFESEDDDETSITVTLDKGMVEKVRKRLPMGRENRM